MTKDSPAVSALKIWIFPSLVSLLGVMIWNDVNEIKADVKALMAQSNIDKTRIDNLERMVYKNHPVKTSTPEDKKADQPAFMELVALKPEDRISPEAEPAKKAL